MKKILTLHAVVLTLSLASYAQLSNETQTEKRLSGKISGTVIDGSTKIIESATITLHKAADSSVAKMSVAGKTGKFEFENVALGKYFVAITAIGHNKGFSEPIEISATNLDVTLKTIELVPQAKSISGVTVTSKKPFIEQKAGKPLI